MLAALRDRHEVVLQAPPGAGKTTLVPLSLLRAPWLKNQKIIVLEPRRLAARAAARRMAFLLGERIAETVGYRVRMDTKIGPGTQIEVVTEGILTRMIQTDPSLEGVGCVIFDEFHERSLHADLGLALTLDARSVLRDDLRLVVMSATLDGDRVAALLDDAPIVSSEGRLFPVTTQYLDRTPGPRIATTAAVAVQKALSETEGDILVFLPGVGEIRRTEEQLEGVDADVRPLFGALSFEQQDAAIRPSEGRRKVVLSTDIAETSLTIEGVRVVVDSGLSRGPMFDPDSGMTRLVTRSTSLASADQRRGRAGRLAPGVCYRLWTRIDHAARAAFDEPEIAQADLAPLLLELALWGIADPNALRWMDRPPASAVESARALLLQLGALDASGITPHGRVVARTGLHPRLAHMVAASARTGHGRLACALAALLEERDLFRGRASEVPTDIRLRLHALLGSGRERSIPGVTLDRATLRRAAERNRDLARKNLKTGKQRTGGDAGIEAAGVLVALAYPDRVAQRVRDGHFRLRNGRPVQIPYDDPLSDSAFLAVATVGGGQDRHRAFLAAPLSREEIEATFSSQIEDTEVTSWDAAAERVVAVRRRFLGAVVLEESALSNPDPALTAVTLLDEIRRRGAHLFPWDKPSRQLQARLAFLQPRDPAIPDRSDGGLLADDQLVPFLIGMKRLTDLRKLDLGSILLNGMDWPLRQAMDRRAPTHFQVPSGSRIPIDYSNSQSPVLAVRLQEVFGLTETPLVDGIPLTMHLLSPAQRPVQVTQDLKGFWASSYFDVRKDMRGRYPKHHWPENPLDAAPTARAKRRRD
ncbi:MAG: ATP-dependent helicase HrpB [Rhodothermales bacterium]